MTIYELADEYKMFLEQVESGEIPDEAIEDTLASLKGDFEFKADNMACMVKNLTAEADGIDEEIRRLTERKKRKHRTAEGVKVHLMNGMTEINIDKIETARNYISLRNNPESVVIPDERKFIDWALDNERDELLKFEEPKPSKSMIKDALKSGVAIPCASLCRNQSVQIK